MIKSKPLHNVSQGYWSLKSTSNHTCDQDMTKEKDGFKIILIIEIWALNIGQRVMKIHQKIGRTKASTTMNFKFNDHGSRLNQHWACPSNQAWGH